MRWLFDHPVCILCMAYAGLFTCLLLSEGCANDGKREAWQDCAGIHHEECRGDLACEYEFYKECINE